MNEKRVVVLDKTLCIGIRKEKRKSRVEKRNCFIRLQLLFFIWHLFHYLLFPDDSIMSSLFLLPKCFTECTPIGNHGQFDILSSFSHDLTSVLFQNMPPPPVEYISPLPLLHYMLKNCRCCLQQILRLQIHLRTLGLSYHPWLLCFGSHGVLFVVLGAWDSLCLSRHYEETTLFQPLPRVCFKQQI